MDNFIDDKVIEKIDSEVNDDYTDDSLFNITSWGADLSFRELISMYSEDELKKPELQRYYVWDRTEASRFIDSILMGLPVPSIFLAQKKSDKLIVDGYQRIMTIYDYVEKGVFSGDGKAFKLSNSNKINEKWRNKTFKELTIEEQRKIRSTTIHAIIFEQKHPKNDDTSLYQIFERINTSGRTLTPQEIRNCVYQGSFNTMLINLNKNTFWRELFGTKKEDFRMRDIEYILRFFVLKFENIAELKKTQISLKQELNNFMGKYQFASETIIDNFSKKFENTMQVIYETVGKNAFKNYANGKFINRFHPTIFDAIAVSFCNALEKGKIIKKIPETTILSLLEDSNFKDSVSIRTTNVENIKNRINLANKYLLK